MSTNKKRNRNKNNQKNKSRNNNNKKVSRRNQGKSQNQNKSRKAQSNKNNNRKSKEILVRVYGEYHCQECDAQWTSKGTYVSQDGQTLYSQECLECGLEVYADYIDDLCYKCNVYPCCCRCYVTDCNKYPFCKCKFEQRVYGYYECRNCAKTWESAYTYVEKGPGYVIYRQQCKRCKLYNKADEVEELIRSIRKSKKPHERSLCERCKKNGYPCD